MEKRQLKKIVEHSERSEKVIERYLCERVRDLGGLCLKYYNANEAGFPDRVVILPGGVTAWVELKGSDGRLAPLQERQIGRLHRLGHDVAVCASRDEVDGLLTRLTAGK